MNLLVVILLPIHLLQMPGVAADHIPPVPAGIHSFMVSESFAEINWQEVENMDAYKIQIWKRQSNGVEELVLEDKTVWLSFYFRVADPDAVYQYRLASMKGEEQSEWSPKFLLLGGQK